MYMEHMAKYCPACEMYMAHKLDSYDAGLSISFASVSCSQNDYYKISSGIEDVIKRFMKILNTELVCVNFTQNHNYKIVQSGLLKN